MTQTYPTIGLLAPLFIIMVWGMVYGSNRKPPGSGS